MTMKENIQKWCDTLSGLLSLKEKHEIKFISQFKNSGYYLPAIQIGSKQPDQHVAWFCEIWMDNQCIFRESRIPINETDNQVEERVLEMLMQSIFNHGVMGAKQILDKMKTTNA